MTTYTTHYSLAKPAQYEQGYHTVFNTGMDNIDTAIWSNTSFRTTLNSINGILKCNGSGTFSAVPGLNTVNGVVAGNGSGTFSASPINTVNGIIACNGSGTFSAVAGVLKSGSVVTPSTSIHTVTSTSFADANGLTVTYTPPSGASSVIVVFCFHIGTDASQCYGEFEFVKNGSAVTSSRCDISLPPYGGLKQTLMYVQSAWSGAQVLKLQTRAFDAAHGFYIHATGTQNGSTSHVYVQPYILVFTI
jgi:hypothetical protein